MSAIAQATSGDLETVLPLFDLYRQFFTRASRLAESRAFLAERFRQADSVIFYSADGEGAEGFVQLYPLLSSWYAKRIWFLSDLYVAERARGRRVATRLLEHAKTFAISTDASSMMVELPHSEPHLVKLYSSLGFAKDAVFDLYRLQCSHGA